MTELSEKALRAIAEALAAGNDETLLAYMRDKQEAENASLAMLAGDISIGGLKVPAPTLGAYLLLTLVESPFVTGREVKGEFAVGLAISEAITLIRNGRELAGKLYAMKAPFHDNEEYLALLAAHSFDVAPLDVSKATDDLCEYIKACTVPTSSIAGGEGGEGVKKKS